MYTTTFRVQGCGPFPLDMLRYDCCYPVDENALRNSDRDDVGWGTTRRVIYLKCNHQYKQNSAPTVGRWQSFGWTAITSGQDKSDWLLGTRKR